ncbi:MAG: hypothetical protein HYW07_17560 [Candidatus Latescibacteria bacterium]|nr:hypothetical protein [Candidatus Latescibacterota bacterium]
MTWNDTVLAHPHLSPTDKLVFHLLGRLGGDTPAVRQQLTALLRLSDRQLRRISARLQQCEAVDNSPAPAASVDNSRTLMSAADIDVRSADTNVRSLNAPTRTLWSSSSEEDVQEKNQYPSPPPPGGAGGEEIPDEFLGEMSRLWKTIAPQECEEPRDWFLTLHREFGPQIPLRVMRQFAHAQRTLSHLRHPPSYKSYFVRCCRRAQEEALTLPGHRPPAPEEHRPLTTADYDLNDF